MSILETITSRRTIKAFKPDPIPKEDILAWLQAASYAPNHRMTEPWEIVFVGPETRAKLNHKTDFGKAPVVIAILSKPATTPFERDENVMAVSCFIQNLMLAAHGAGAGVFWSSVGATPHNRAILKVEDQYDVVGLLGIGYAAEVPALKDRTSVEAKISYLA